ncbi:MAG: PAS domain S-box protein, partial [bacterium]
MHLRYTEGDGETDKEREMTEKRRKRAPRKTERSNSPPARTATGRDAARRAPPAWEWEATFNSIADAVFITDLDGTLLRCNQATLRAVGMEKTEIIGRKYWDVLHGSPLPLPDSPLFTMQEYRRRVSLVIAIANRQYGTRVDPLLDGPGTLVGAIFIMSDITERLKTNELIRHTKEELEDVLRASPAAIVTVDLELVNTSWNPAAERIFGWTALEAIGHRNTEIPRDVYGTHADAYARVLQGETLTGLEARWHRKNGSPVDITFAISPLRNAAGAVAGSALFILDVTDLKRIGEIVKLQEAEVHQLQKMEAIGRLAGGMAHDLNNILTAIIGYSDILTDKLEGNAPLRGHAQAVLTSAERAAALCQHLLTFSKRQVYALCVVNLNGVLASSDQLL